MVKIDFILIKLKVIFNDNYSSYGMYAICTNKKNPKIMTTMKY